VPPPQATVPLTVEAVATLVGGRLVGGGDGSQLLTAVGSLAGADGETLSLLASARYLADFRASRAGAVLLTSEWAPDPEGPALRIIVSDPQKAMARALEAMFPSSGGGGVHPTVRLGKGVVLGMQVRLGPGVVLEAGVIVGEGTELEAMVLCHRGTRIGRRCRIKSGSVLGGPGFGYVSAPSGHARILHVGGCVLGDDVEVGANCTIDRGSIDDTVIGDGTKLDNLVHVGHNARLGARCLVMGGSVIAGSAELGDGVIVAGHVAIGGHFRVGNRARIGAKSGVISAVPEGADYSGFPARPHREFLRAQAAMYRLAKITDELEELVRTRTLHA